MILSCPKLYHTVQCNKISQIIKTVLRQPSALHFLYYSVPKDFVPNMEYQKAMKWILDMLEICSSNSSKNSGSLVILAFVPQRSIQAYWLRYVWLTSLWAQKRSRSWCWQSCCSLSVNSCWFSTCSSRMTNSRCRTNWSQKRWGAQTPFTIISSKDCFPWLFGLI